MTTKRFSHTGLYLLSVFGGASLTVFNLDGPVLFSINCLLEGIFTRFRSAAPDLVQVFVSH